ncbi:retrovirus-related pol polyprotein from transposon TNT 1-94 [Tanacetum coccineum]
MDLCGPMRIASINGRRYVLVIVDDYSRYTWVHFLRSKDEAPEVIKTFLKRITVLLQSPVIIIRTDNGTEFKNQISHQASSVRTPQQNRVVERRNRTLVEAARTMLIFYSYGLKRLLLRATLKTAPSFTVDLTKHHTSSLTAENWIYPFFMYSGLSFIPRMIVKILGSLVQKVILAFTLVTLLIPVLTEFSTEGQRKSWRQRMTRSYLCSANNNNSTTQQPTEGELDLLFEAMYDDHIVGQPSAAPRTVLAAQAP